MSETTKTDIAALKGKQVPKYWTVVSGGFVE